MPAQTLTSINKPKRIAVLNSKGGCGKSMLSTNLASLYASKNINTALIDHDPQNTAIRWLERRNSNDVPEIYGINAASQATNVTRSFRMRIPPEIERVIIDTPAGVRGHELNEFIHTSDYVIIPVMTSEGDLNAAEYFFNELNKHAKIRNLSTQVCIVGNRAKKNTNAFQTMKQFIENIHFPCLCVLHDTQNYVTASEQGVGIHELANKSKVKEELRSWKYIYNWIENQQVDFIPDRISGPPQQTINQQATDAQSSYSS